MHCAGLSTSHYAWAFHSEAEEELLNMLPALQKGDPAWPELRAMGLGWWLRSTPRLRRCIEKVSPASARCCTRSSQSRRAGGVWWLMMLAFIILSMQMSYRWICVQCRCILNSSVGRRFWSTTSDNHCTPIFQVLHTEVVLELCFEVFFSCFKCMLFC